MPSTDVSKAGKGERRPKLHAANLIPMFRKAALFRNEMKAAGFSDNGGAIHSATRILDILGQRLNYPGLSHLNNLRNYSGAKFSVKARAHHEGGGKVRIEHVAPMRDFTSNAIERITNGASDEQLEQFVRDYYRLVLLTEDQAQHLDRQNRSMMKENRLETAGIQMEPDFSKQRTTHGRFQRQGCRLLI